MLAAELDSETWRAFHGVPICLAYAGLDGDPLRPLLAGFDPTTPLAPCIRVELSTAPPPPDASGSGWVPSFCHGQAQGYTNGSRHRLSDGRVLLEIEPERGLLRGFLAGNAVTELGSGMLHVGLCLLLREHSIFDAHAAVATIGGDAFMVAGDSGAGKTSTLLALLGAGAAYLGDDRVLMRPTALGVELLGYPREFRVTEATLRAHPTLAATGSASALDGKLRVDAQRAFASSFRRSAQGRITLLSATIGDQPITQIRRLSAADTLGVLLSASATVALEVLSHRDEQLEALAALANRGRGFEVSLGRDLLLDPGPAAARLLELLRNTP